ncbi:MAG: 30S ribosome-binding factor RbfA [Gemmatimonadales bacterium]|nr:MAG: 30S ribosome-binding factor RbfA [Gemmatimonadales bacterium]
MLAWPIPSRPGWTHLSQKTEGRWWFEASGRSGSSMGSKRRARLNEQFKREITEILRREVRDPRVGSPTITGVEVTPDLWMARIYVRPGPLAQAEPSGTEGPSTTKELLEGLDASAPFVRRALGKVLSLRRIPELRFQLDRSMEHAARIEELLREVRPDPEDTDAELPADPSEEPGARGADGTEEPGARGADGTEREKGEA